MSAKLRGVHLAAAGGVESLAHTAALYTVRVKERYRDYRPLGDIDGGGRRLLDVLAGYLPAFESAGVDSSKVVRCLNSRVENDELVALMLHGQSGVAADIVSEQGQRRLRQIWTDTQLIQCGCLFRLPPTQTPGWLSLQVNNGRGIKGLLETGLYERFRNDFPDLMLELKPFVRGSALREAIEGNKVSKVRLIRYERPHDRAVAETDKWVRTNEFGKIELDISARGRGQMLKSALLRRFLQSHAGSDDAFADIVEFGGIEFEQAKVEVEVNGRTRTFNLETPTSGHPMTVDLDDLDFDDDGEPSEDSVIAGLRDALGYV